MSKPSRTDMVVQMDLSRPIDEHPRRVVVRFRSLLSYRPKNFSKSHRTPDQYDVDTCHECDADLTRTHSDSCITRYSQSSHVDNIDHSEAVSVSRCASLEEIESLGERLIEHDDDNFYEHLTHLNSNANSFSTADISWLQALRCLPSVEWLDQTSSCESLDGKSEQMTPTSSLRKHHSPLSKADFNWKSMRNHPLYCDVKNQQRSQHLRDLVDALHREEKVYKRSRNSNSETKVNTSALFPSCSSSNKKQGPLSKRRPSRGDITPPLIRRVHFADEESCSSSLTTLNSIPSYSSIYPAGDPNQAIIGGGNSDRRNMSAQSLSDQSGQIDSIGSQLRSIKLDKSDRPHNYNPVGQFLQKMRRKRKERRRCRPPMVTVNLITDMSEPPKIPKHVIQRLDTAKPTYWQPIFARPDESPRYQHHLAQDQIALARLHSTSMTSIHLTVNTHVYQPLASISPASICLRYTLNHWVGCDESQSIPLSSCWLDAGQPNRVVELYEGTVDLTQTTRHVPVDQYERDRQWTKLEFALVCRRNQHEYWDNNDGKNFVCARTSN